MAGNLDASGVLRLGVLLASLAVAAPACADKLDAIKARGKLLIGVSESSPPFSFRDDGKGIVGYDVDLAERVAQKLGVAAAKVPLINAQRIAALQQARADLIAVGMTRAKKRAKEVDFSYAYLDSPHMILVRTDGGVEHIAQLAGRTLALVRSASVDTQLKAALPTLRIAYFDSYDAAFAALSAQRVDAFLADKMLLLSLARQSGHAADFAVIADYQLPRTAGFALPKNEPHFLHFVDQTLIDLEASGEAAKIFDKWFAPLRRDFRIQPD